MEASLLKDHLDGESAVNRRGRDWKQTVITGYCISTEEMGRIRSKWIAVKEAKGMKRFREDEEGEFSQRWWPIRNGAWMRRTEPRVNLQASDLSAGETQWRFILMHCEWPQLLPFPSLMPHRLPFPKLTVCVHSSRHLHTMLAFPALGFSSPCCLFCKILNF